MKNKIFYYYHTLFKYIAGYSFIVLSAIIGYVVLHTLILNSSSWLLTIMASLWSLVFYFAGNKLIKMQNIQNEILETVNMLHYLRYYFNLHQSKMHEIISILFFIDALKTMKTNRPIYQALEWRVEKSRITCSDFVLLQIEEFLAKSSQKQDDMEREAIISQRMLKDTQYLDQVVKMLKNRTLFEIPLAVNLEQDHDFVMSDYYHKGIDEK